MSGQTVETPSESDAVSFTPDIKVSSISLHLIFYYILHLSLSHPHSLVFKELNTRLD
jgi:hypothetical protein